MQTEVSFTLPKGHVDPPAPSTARAPCAWRLLGTRSRPYASPQVRQNEAYLSPCCCCHGSMTKVGEVTEVTPELIEGLYAADFDHLQRLYERLNTDGEAVGSVTCPSCSHAFEVDLTEIEDGRLGE